MGVITKGAFTFVITWPFRLYIYITYWAFCGRSVTYQFAHHAPKENVKYKITMDNFATFCACPTPMMHLVNVVYSSFNCRISSRVELLFGIDLPLPKT